MLDRFVELGYVVLTQVIPVEVAAETAAELRKISAWNAVFGADGWDPNRAQHVAPADIAEDMSDRLRRYWKSFYPKSEANDWHALRSLPRGEKQPPHTDFSFPKSFPHLDHINMPAGIIVALEPGTHLLVYGWNRLAADMREEKLVALDVGDAIIFRGDLIHAGGKYENENIRLHAYLDVQGARRKRDNTQLMPVVVYDEDPTKCSLHDCIITGTTDTIKKHVLRVHRARFNNKAASSDAIARK